MTSYLVIITGPAGSGRQRFIDAVADVVIDRCGYLSFGGDLNLQLSVRDLGAGPDTGVVLGTILLLPAPQPTPGLPHPPVVAVAAGDVPAADVTRREPSLDRAAAKRTLITLVDLAAERAGA